MCSKSKNWQSCVPGSLKIFKNSHAQGQVTQQISLARLKKFTCPTRNKKKSLIAYIY
jgi:hypothetical protein